jgi:hypothetical protein
LTTSFRRRARRATFFVLKIKTIFFSAIQKNLKPLSEISLGIALEMSDIKEVVIVEPVIAVAEAASVASSVDEELVSRMAENFEELEVYQEPYHFNRGTMLADGTTDEQWLNAPDHIKSGVYYNTFGGGPEGGYFKTDYPNALYSLERTWGQKYKWTAVLDRQLERQLFQDEDTFKKDGDTFEKEGRSHIRIWKHCPDPVFNNDIQINGVYQMTTGCSPFGYKKLILPFFLMGAPGIPSARTSIAWLQRPKAINQAFLLRVADKLNKEPCRDWDWEGFRDNLIEPNFNHIQIHHRITDPKIMARWVYDLNVFLNNSNEKDTVEKKRGKPNKIHLAPSIKNINNPADIEY